MTKYLRIILALLLMIWNVLVFGQSINGNISVQLGETNHTWTSVRIDTIKTQCDSTGHFQLTKIISDKDTIIISPIPLFLAVNIINIPTNSESLTFDSIPLFKDIRKTVPVVNFKSKRASRRYMRNEEKEYEVAREQLINDIQSRVYKWKDREYDLKIEAENQVLTVIIDLQY